jgi:hypothetical protein
MIKGEQGEPLVPGKRLENTFIQDIRILKQSVPCVFQLPENG